MASWQIHEAKSRLSEVIEKAVSEGPQTITRHGKARAVVLSAEAYDALSRGKPNLIDFLLKGPRLGDLDLERDRSPPRDIDL